MRIRGKKSKKRVLCGKKTMSFRFYTNLISQASRNAAMGIFTVGLLLVGFGVLVIAFSEIFAFLAAAVFFIMGLGCAITAVKIYLAQRRFNKMIDDSSRSSERRGSQPYRENVEIHSEEYYDI